MQDVDFDEHDRRDCRSFKERSYGTFDPSLYRATRVKGCQIIMARGDFISAAKLADLEKLAKAVGLLERNNQMDDFFADMYSFENVALLGPELMDELRNLIDKYGRMEVFKVCQWLPKIMAAADGDEV